MLNSIEVYSPGQFVDSMILTCVLINANFIRLYSF